MAKPQPKNQQSTPAKLLARERERQAVQMRLAGLAYRKIAERLNITEGGAYQCVARVLKRTRQAADEDADELRQVELERLDVMLTAVWPSVVKGNNAAIQSAVGIVRQRSKLLGLEAPAITRLVGGDGGPIQTVVTPFDWARALGSRPDEPEGAEDE